MPIDYKEYPPNWKTEIRPAILARENYCCKFCKAPNHSIVCRGMWNGRQAYQNDDGQIFDAKTGEYMGSSYVGDVWVKEQRLTKIILTIAHLDQDKTNNDYRNLAALCQKCHLGIDLKHHMANARETNRKKKGLQNLF